MRDRAEGRILQTTTSMASNFQVAIYAPDTRVSVTSFVVDPFFYSEILSAKAVAPITWRHMSFKWFLRQTPPKSGTGC